MRCRTALTLAALLVAAAGPTRALDLYVSPTGSPQGNGSVAAPLDLATAIGGLTPARPGDTIWLRGGVYKGDYLSTLTGLAGKPIIVKQAPNERATIDGSLTVKGAWAYYWGFELTNTTPDYITWKSAVEVHGPYTKLINLIIHDAPQGIGSSSLAIGAEVYGCIIYNNGFLGAGRQPGHGMYVQNETGTKRMVDNVLFDQYGYGFHAYSQRGLLNGLYFEGNASFDNHGSDIWLGGTRNPAQGVTFFRNYTYGPSGVTLGYWATGNHDMLCAENIFTSSQGAVQFGNWDKVTARGNLVCSPGRLVTWIPDPTVAVPSNTFSKNTYYSTGTAPNPFVTDGVAFYTFADWQKTYSFDLDSSWTRTTPTGASVIVRRNVYDSGRAHVIVYNWAQKNQVSVNISGLIPKGARYEIRFVQDPFGRPVASGTSNGGYIMLPMTGTKSSPGFNAFIVTIRGR